MEPAWPAKVELWANRRAGGDLRGSTMFQQGAGDESGRAIPSAPGMAVLNLEFHVYWPTGSGTSLTSQL